MQEAAPEVSDRRAPAVMSSAVIITQPLSRRRGIAYLGGMKDLNALMQQAQAMQQKLQDAQAKMAESAAEGSSGGGLVTIALRGPGEVTSVRIDDSLLVPGEGEILADLIVAAHADAKRRLDEVNGALMREAAGPMAGMNIPGMPKLF